MDVNVVIEARKGDREAFGRLPVHQLPHPAARKGRAETGAGVDPPGIDGPGLRHPEG